MRSVVLIGPYGAGKSTIGRLLAAARDQASYSLDDNVWTYYGELGLTRETAAAVGEFDAPDWQRYHAHAVTRFLQDHQHEVCIMDLGAGHALYEGAYLEQMQTVCDPYAVILLIPSPDPAVSIHDLNARNRLHTTKHAQPHTAWNAFFLAHPSSHQLATYVVYTKDKTPVETCADVLALLQE